MWTLKKFKTHQSLMQWMAENYYRYQMVQIYIQNGYACEYRKLRRVY